MPLVSCVSSGCSGGDRFCALLISCVALNVCAKECGARCWHLVFSVWYLTAERAVNVQGVGGFVINSGSDKTTSHVTANSNQISQEAVENDHTYQCYGSCSLTSTSSGNTHCGGDPAPAFGSSAFVSTDCAAQNARLQALRANYPSSQMPRCPRYMPFKEAKGYDCVD